MHSFVASILLRPTRLDRGAGVWRGHANGGALPKLFPKKSVMFVAHNFDSERGFAISLDCRGEVGGPFWQRLLRVLSAAGIDPDECFFTNALMGLKPGKGRRRDALSARLQAGVPAVS